jgi:cytochrome c5
VRIVFVSLAIAAAAACYSGPVLQDPYERPVVPQVIPATFDCTSGVDDSLAPCQSCHSDPPRGAPNALTTRAQLMARSATDPTKTMAEVSVERMRDAANPMPPTGVAAKSDVDRIVAWIAAGYPEGQCGGGTNLFAADPVCTSGKTGIHLKSGDGMEPGVACIDCHVKKKRQAIVSVGGTIYPSAHEPANCAGSADTALNVVFTNDSSGKETRIAVAAQNNGNFSSRAQFVPGAYHVRLETKDNRRVMGVALTMPQDGDCNRCHTDVGAEGAPGRLIDPRSK